MATTKRKIKYIFTTPEKYHALEEKNPGYLYFLTSGELYRGDILYGSQISIINNSSIPMEGTANRIYYNEDDRSLSIWKNNKWKLISPVISDNVDLSKPGGVNANDNLVTVDALKKYINTLVDRGIILSSSNGAVANLPISNIKLQEDISVTNQDIGNYKNGDVINTGTSVETIIKNMLTKVKPVEYKYPKLSVTPTTILIEAGTKEKIHFTITYSQEDAGKLKAFHIFRGYNKVFTEPIHSWNNLISMYKPQVPDIIGEYDSVDYKFVVEYEDGELRQDSSGALQHEGAIKAGKVETICSFIGKRASWFESVKEDIDVMTSKDIRELKGTSIGKEKGDSFSLDVNIGDKAVIIAIPKSLGELTSITSHTLHMDITSNFTLTNVMIEGANGYRAIDYNVYKYTPNIPFVSKDTFDIVI